MSDELFKAYLEAQKEIERLKAFQSKYSLSDPPWGESLHEFAMSYWKSNRTPPGVVLIYEDIRIIPVDKEHIDHAIAFLEGEKWK